MGECSLGRPPALHCLCAGTCHGDWAGWGSSELNARVQKHIHTQPRCSQLFHSRSKTCSYFFKKRKTQTQSSCFLTTSNHISQKCLLTRSTDPSQNFSHVLIKMCGSSIILSCYRTCVCPLLFCLVLSDMLQSLQKWANSMQKVRLLFN